MHNKQRSFSSAFCALSTSLIIVSVTVLASAQAIAQCPPQGLTDIYDFTPQEVGGGVPGNIVIDGAGNLYGLIAGGGNYGQGLLYKLAERDGNWLLDPLYNFLGGSQGSSTNNLILGPQGAVYGGASGGSQNYGLIYKANPGPTACTTALCSWTECTLYQFTGNNDAVDASVNAYDSAGNLYGISFFGGASGYGTIFELTPSPGGWTETILHNFTEGCDGAWPTSLLMGHDGNLYGTASTGGCYGYGTIFQLVPSGGGWTLNVLYTFIGTYDGIAPGNLVQDSLGNFYGSSGCSLYSYCNGINDNHYGLVFKLSRSGGRWQLNVLYDTSEDNLCSGSINGVALDAAGRVYATAGLEPYCFPGWGALLDVTANQVLVPADGNIFQDVTVAASGKLYGTFGEGCGKYDLGMVWQYSPPNR